MDILFTAQTFVSALRARMFALGLFTSWHLPNGRMLMHADAEYHRLDHNIFGRLCVASMSKN